MAAKAGVTVVGFEDLPAKRVPVPDIKPGVPGNKHFPDGVLIPQFVAEDVKVGKLTSFPQSVKLKTGETVVFSWITYRSRKHRDKVMEKVMKDPRITAMMDPKKMPFDTKRMFFGGFDTIVTA